MGKYVYQIIFNRPDDTSEFMGFIAWGLGLSFNEILDKCSRLNNMDKSLYTGLPKNSIHHLSLALNNNPDGNCFYSREAKIISISKVSDTVAEVTVEADEVPVEFFTALVTAAMYTIRVERLVDKEE